MAEEQPPQPIPVADLFSKAEILRRRPVYSAQYSSVKTGNEMRRLVWDRVGVGGVFVVVKLHVLFAIDPKSSDAAFNVGRI